MIDADHDVSAAFSETPVDSDFAREVREQGAAACAQIEPDPNDALRAHARSQMRGADPRMVRVIMQKIETRIAQGGADERAVEHVVAAWLAPLEDALAVIDPATKVLADSKAALGG